MVFLEHENQPFPPVSSSDNSGLLAVGGSLSSHRLLLAYNQGIFPWYSDGQPVLWYCPDPRMVLFPNDLKVSKSMRKIIRSQTFQISENKAFAQVIAKCATVPRPEQDGTWITDEMIIAYTHLHQLGYAKSVEVWQNNELVGGLYGVDLPEKRIFCGESMFSTVSNASKLAFIHLVRTVLAKGYKFVDCQMYTDHLASLGANEIPRNDFIRQLHS